MKGSAWCGTAIPGWGLCLGLALGGCVGSDPSVVPDRGLGQVVLTETASPAEPPILSRTAAHSVTGVVPATEDSFVTARCGLVEIRASPPQRVRGGECREQYLVDLSVETDLVDAGVLDLFRSYDMADWRLHVSGGRVRHDLSLVWRPYRYASYEDDRPGWVFNAGNVSQPLTIRVCPEEPEGVLACSDTECGIYDSEDEVPQVDLPTQGLVIESPWSFEEARDAREGSTLRVPVPYFIGSAGSAVILDFNRFLRGSSREYRMDPERYELRDTPGFGTATFRLTFERDGIAQDPSVEVFNFGIGYRNRPAGCIAIPREVRVRVRDR